MIYPLPYSSYINTSGEPVLSQHSILALLASLEYLKLHQDEAIMLVAEQTFGHKSHKTTDLMQQFFIEHKVNIQNIRTVEKVANNTYEQLEAIRQIVGDEVVTLIAFAFHVPRIKVISRRLGLNIYILTVEELLKDNLELSNKIKEINSSPKMQRVLRMEKLFLKLAKLDTNGLVPKTYSFLFGSRTPLI